MPTSEREPMAALRDASIFRTHHQTVTRALGYLPVHHIIGPDGFYSCCGILLDPSTEQRADSCMARCQRPACKKRWPIKGNESP